MDRALIFPPIPVLAGAGLKMDGNLISIPDKIEVEERTVYVPLSTPFSIVNGSVIPGLVGGLMPTINGDPLDATTETVPSSGNYVVYFTLNFTVTYTETYLTSYTFDSVTVNTAASVPADTDDTKYLQFNTVTGGVPVASYFDSYISVSLYDNGPNSTGLGIL
jgi:hypothetical protein